MSYIVGHRCGLGLELLWRRPVATAPVRPLAWEPPYATGMGVALKRQKKTKKINEINKGAVRKIDTHFTYVLVGFKIILMFYYPGNICSL